ATIGAAVAGRSGAAGARSGGQSDIPNMPVPAARVKQDHEMAPPPLVTAELGPDKTPDGAAGPRPEPPPHAARATDAVVKKTSKYDRIQPPRVRRQQRIVWKCTQVRQIASSTTSCGESSAVTRKI